LSSNGQGEEAISSRLQRAFAGDEGSVFVVMPGQLHIARPRERISTLLGSCVAVCMRDVRLGLGGMNHLMLPGPEGGGGSGSARGESEPGRYGPYAMTELLGGLLVRGAQLSSLEVKVFGGARMLSGMNDIGAQNIAFVRRFLAAQKLPIAAEEVGSSQARKILYDPSTGEVLVHRLSRVAFTALPAQDRPPDSRISEQE
jgi:chemotaxis protein CheD